MTSDDRRKEFFALMRRFNQLGAMLPDPDNFDPTDAAAFADATMVLDEMNETRAAMDAVLDKQAAAEKQKAAP